VDAKGAAYRRRRMPWKRPQVLGADLNNPISGHISRIFGARANGRLTARLEWSTPRAGRKPRRGCIRSDNFYALWSVNRRVDGGLGLPLKLVQARLGPDQLTP